MKLAPWRKSRESLGAQGYHPLFNLQNDINSLFDDWLNDDWRTPLSEAKQAFVPAIDLIQKDKSYEVKAVLPGVKEDEIDLYIEDGYMVIKGEHKDEKKEEKDDYIVHESSYGSFYRSLPLPKDVDTEQDRKATLKDGVLTIELAKQETAKSKKEKIDIKAG